MKIDGKILAEKVLEGIKNKLTNLPPVTLAIVTLGPEDAWEHYVSQKIKLAKQLGIKTQLINIKNPTEEKLIGTIEQLNNDNNVTGMIIQRPLTRHIEGTKITYAVSPKKDIDGFIKDAYFKPPVWLAIRHILSEIANLENQTLDEFLKGKTATVLGKGETAGIPVIEGMRNLGVELLIIDSKTENKSTILKNADIVISAVGKSTMFNVEDLKRDVIVIGIGLHRENEKLQPDFDEKEVSKIAKYYTPTPGGVGPLNLAYLFKNLISAARLPIA